MKVYVGSNGKLPEKGSKFAAGWDLFSSDDVMVNPHSRVVVPTDINVAIEPGWYGRIAPRSGLSVKNSIDIGAGVIDSDYRGNIGVVLINNGNEVFFVNKGDKIAQLVITKYNDCPLTQVSNVSDLQYTERGTAGFGSTGI